MRKIKEKSLTTKEALFEAISWYKGTHEDGQITLEQLLSVMQARTESEQDETLNTFGYCIEMLDEFYSDFIKQHIDLKQCSHCYKWFYVDDHQFLEDEACCIFCYQNDFL